MGVSVSNTNGCHRFTGNLSPLADAQPHTTNADDRVYELTNHLGNVLATFTGRKLPVTEADLVVGFAPHVTSLSDYYPFGSGMEGREVPSGYRYGFNGKENIDEVAGQGNWQDYGERMYDPRLGRFPSPDPLIVFEQKYPWYSSYQFAGNKPVWKVDVDGLEEGELPMNTGVPQLRYPNSEELKATFGPDANEKIFRDTEDSDFAKRFEITWDELGQRRLASTLLDIELTETHQDSRPNYSGKVVSVTTQLKDEALVSDNNPDGWVPGTWRKYSLPEEFVPENTGSTVNPGQPANDLPEVEVGNGKSIVFAITVVVYDDQ